MFRSCILSVHGHLISGYDYYSVICAFLILCCMLFFSRCKHGVQMNVAAFFCNWFGISKQKFVHANTVMPITLNMSYLMILTVAELTSLADQRVQLSCTFFLGITGPSCLHHLPHFSHCSTSVDFASIFCCDFSIFSGFN